MLNLVRLIRLPNLLIVALVQFIIYLKILVPIFEDKGITTTLPLLQFSLFVVTTILITAGGYIINDILDYETDLINKGESVILNKKIAVESATWLYLTASGGGFFIAIYLAFFVGHLDWVTLYPISIGGLFVYSRFLKKMPLLGNLTVAVFAAGVAGIILLAEKNGLAQLTQLAPLISLKIYLVVGFYMLFAFYTSLFRELIKDIEDIEGDAHEKYRTLPILLGVPKVKKLAMVFAVSLLILMIGAGWFFWDSFTLLNKFALSPVTLGAMVWILFLLNKAEQKQDFHAISQWTKLVMLGGILILLGLHI